MITIGLRAIARTDISISVIPIHRSDVAVKYAMLTLLEEIVNISLKYRRSVLFLKVIVWIGILWES